MDVVCKGGWYRNTWTHGPGQVSKHLHHAVPTSLCAQSKPSRSDLFNSHWPLSNYDDHHLKYYRTRHRLFWLIYYNSYCTISIVDSQSPCRHRKSHCSAGYFSSLLRGSRPCSQKHQQQSTWKRNQKRWKAKYHSQVHPCEPGMARTWTYFEGYKRTRCKRKIKVIQGYTILWIQGQRCTLVGVPSFQYRRMPA